MNLRLLIGSIKKIDIYRVRNWFYYIGFVILGTTISNSLEAIRWESLLVSIFALAFIFSINDFADNETKKKYFLFPLVLFLFSFYLLNPQQMLSVLFFLIIQLIYSFRPFRFKGIPVLGTLSCALTFPQFFLIGYLEKDRPDWKAWSIFSVLVMLSAILQIIHEVDHMEKDCANRDKTSAVFFGKKSMERTCITLFIITIVLTFFLYAQQWLSLLAFLALSVFYIAILISILISGIRYYIWNNFRILALISGLIWFLTELR